tara:strand:+ start:127 stop:291 length:165 start_codon:yes stop_codon:yes gene_type:complete
MKKVKFYNYLEGDKICEGILEEDSMFIGGYKITYKNMIVGIKLVKLVEKEKGEV